jgi:hypothetical protein
MMEGEDSFRNREDTRRRFAERLGEYRDEDFERMGHNQVIVLLRCARRD